MSAHSAKAQGADESAASAVDLEHPWLGLVSFTEETRGFFHGREEEVAELGRRVQRKLLTILFGQSGLGKTSILRAGIVPRLRPEGFCPVYVRVDYSPDSPPPTEQIKQAIFRATEATGTWTQPGTATEGESLWEFLHHHDDILKDANAKTVIPLLIFDQFEEIFTLAQADATGRARAAQFIADLADLVENRPPKALEAKLEADDSVTERFDFGRADYRILVALREDYLAHLEGLKGEMPSITQNRMRLARMNGQQALAAVMKPGGKLVSEEVAESIVRFVAGGAELRNAEVEPSLLSLICRELNNTRIAQGRAEISADLLAGSHDTILSEFYERALADQPPAVRKAIEDELLTESGYRENLAEERVLKAFAEAGAAPDALATLVNRRLLRVEERLDRRRVELTHDVLCGVVKASRELRLAREAREETERELEAQRAREAATRKSLLRARQIALGCAVLALGAVVSAIFGYVNLNRAKEAQTKAQQTRQMAETARGESEKLLVYLLEDLRLELEPIGRIEIVASLSKRALDYYEGLPPALRTPATERNRALAEVRYAISLRNLGRLEESAKQAAAAVATLEDLRAKGDSSEATTIGLAMGLAAKGRIYSQQNRVAESRKENASAMAVIEPVGSAPDASLPARRAYGEISISYGFILNRESALEDAEKTFEKARTAYRGIAGLKLEDLSAAAGFAEATAWQIPVQVSLGWHAQATRNGEEALAVANAVLERQPGHLQALRSRGLLLAKLGHFESDQLRFKSAIPFYAATARDHELHLKVDPGNTITRQNLGNILFLKGLHTEGVGRPREALRHLRDAAQSTTQGKMTERLAESAAWTWMHISRLEAELGNDAASRKAVAESTRYSDLAMRDQPPGSVVRKIREVWNSSWDAQRRLILGDFSGARDKAASSVGHLEGLKPETEDQKRFQSDMLMEVGPLLSAAAYMTKDYALAEATARGVLKRVANSPPQNRIQEVFWAQHTVDHAIALARLGRLADARAALEPALKFHRQFPDLSQAEMVRIRRAHLRLAQALANPGESRELLAQAAVLIDTVSPEYRAMATVARLRNEIAREIAARR